MRARRRSISSRNAAFLVPSLPRPPDERIARRIRRRLRSQQRGRDGPAGGAAVRTGDAIRCRVARRPPLDIRPPCPATRSWASWAAAAWASSTRPGTSSCNRVVALKMILAGGHAGEADLARFQTEAEAVARLQHPNIVQIYEVGEHDGLPFFSLEFCGGGSLDKKLAGTPLPPKEAAALVETLARAMQAAHEQGRHPPRPEAGQRAADGGRHAEDHRLRPGEEAGRGRADADRGGHGHAAATWRRSRPAARRRRSGRRATCMRWGRSCTSA